MEMVRSVRDQRFRYQRNFYPHLPYKPHEDFEFNAPVLKKWVALAREGKLTGPQAMMNLRFKPIEELYDSQNDPHMINNLIDDPKYADVVKAMRTRLHGWMLKTRDLGILDEAETLVRAETHPSHWDLAQSLDNYPRMLETANLQVKGKAAIPELLARVDAPDAGVRFWGVLGLVALRSDDDKVLAALKSAAQDESISVAITAADGLFNLEKYDEGLPAILKALRHPIPAAQVRAACVLDTQPSKANQKLQTALPALRAAAAKLNVRQMRGIPYGLNEPLKRAAKAITGEATYYRW